MNTAHFKTSTFAALPAHGDDREMVLSHRRASLHRSIIGLILYAAALLVLPATADAQGYSVSWFKMAGGGGACSNGSFSVSATIGQYDAGGPLTNGVFSVTGGFWAVIQTPGAPTLKIVSATPGYVTISWSPNTPCWLLQDTVGLAPANWADSPSGTNNPVTVPINSPTKFYRLTMR